MPEDGHDDGQEQQGGDDAEQLVHLGPRLFAFLPRAC